MILKGHLLRGSLGTLVALVNASVIREPFPYEEKQNALRYHGLTPSAQTFLPTQSSRLPSTISTTSCAPFDGCFAPIAVARSALPAKLVALTPGSTAQTLMPCLLSSLLFWTMYMFNAALLALYAEMSRPCVGSQVSVIVMDPRLLLRKINRGSFLDSRSNGINLSVTATVLKTFVVKVVCQSSRLDGLFW